VAGIVGATELFRSEVKRSAGMGGSANPEKPGFWRFAFSKLTKKPPELKYFLFLFAYN